MADIWLVGNGHWCASCGGTGKGKGIYALPKHPDGGIPEICQSCAGAGRLPGPGPAVDRPETSNYVVEFKDAVFHHT